MVAIIVIVLSGIVIGNWVKTDNLIAELENTTPIPRNTELEDAMKKLANNSDKMIRAINALNLRKISLEVLKESSKK